jgi:hypothetical protein
MARPGRTTIKYYRYCITKKCCVCYSVCIQINIIATIKNDSNIYFSKDNLLKNRIPVPHNDGRNLFGIADETKELEYGQCFIQYSLLESKPNSQRRFRVVTGRFYINIL